MTHVATLVTPAVLTRWHLDQVAAVLPGAGTARWLSSGVAADIPFAPPPRSGNPRWSEAARRVLGDDPIDVVVQPATGRRRRLLVADMDATIIAGESIDELGRASGRAAEVAELTRRSVRGEAGFEQSLRERVAQLAGLALEDAERVAGRLTLNPGAATLVATMRANGATTVLASGGFTLFTARVAEEVGFDRHHGNVLEVAEGRLTGRVREPILGRAAKADILRRTCEEMGLTIADTLAVGDGANDLAMLEEAGLGVAFAATPAVAAVARARIDHCDLTALLYLQGYEAADFVG